MEISSSKTFNAPLATIWSLLADFGAIQKWWPSEGAITIDRVQNEGEGVGMIRHIFNHGMTNAVSERLDFIDHDNTTLILSIVGDRPAGITAYVAIGRLSPVGENQCVLEYQAFITCPKEKENSVARNIKFTWETMFQGIEQCALEMFKTPLKTEAS